MITISTQKTYTFHIISAHNFPQSLKREAILQLFNGEAQLLGVNRLTVLLLWNNSKQMKRAHKMLEHNTLHNIFCNYTTHGSCVKHK